MLIEITRNLRNIQFLIFNPVKKNAFKIVIKRLIYIISRIAKTCQQVKYKSK